MTANTIRYLLYGFGVLLAALGATASPTPWLGLVVAGGGLVWACYDVYDDGEEPVHVDAPSTPPRR